MRAYPVPATIIDRSAAKRSDQLLRRRFEFSILPSIARAALRKNPDVEAWLGQFFRQETLCN